MKLTRKAIFAVSTMILAPAMAHGKGSVPISISVPESCSLSAPSVTIEPGDPEARATLFENCNITSGFVIRAMHRPLGDTEEVSIIYDGGEPVALSGSNSTSVADRRGAKYGNRTLALSSANIEAPLTVSFALERR